MINLPDLEIPQISLEPFLETLLNQRLGLNHLSVELRREVKGPSDVSIVIRGRARLDRSRREQLRHALEQGSAIESVRVNENRLSIRLTVEAIRALERGYDANAPMRQLFHHLGEGRRCLVDFGDPNLTKPFHVGHLRNLCLGHSIASMLRASGAAVTTQSIICDIGRNVAEALASWMSAGKPHPTNVGLKGDHLIGQLYSAYVGASQTSNGNNNSIDIPLERELLRKGDYADEVLDRWRIGDTAIREAWSTLIKWVDDGQTQTLRELGIQFDAVIPESLAIPRMSSFLESGLNAGVFVQLDDGVIVYRTGRLDYPTMILTRSDGFPTEHLRALILWDHLRRQHESCDLACHVMGDEWTSSTEIRIQALARIAPDSFFPRYKILPYAMVTLEGSRMKSSGGEVITIDDLLDRLAEKFNNQPPQRLHEIKRAAAFGWCLGAPMGDPHEVSLQSLLDPQRNFGLGTILALHVLEDAFESREVDEGGASSAWRFGVLQSWRLRRVIESCITSLDPVSLFRFITRLAAATTLLSEEPVAATRIAASIRSGLGIHGILDNPLSCSA